MKYAERDEIATLRGRRLAIYSLACFAIALALSLLLFGVGRGGSGGDMAGAGFALLLIGSIHLLALVGGILGFFGLSSSKLAQRALWMNALLLVAFWTWALFFSRY